MPASPAYEAFLHISYYEWIGWMKFRIASASGRVWISKGNFKNGETSVLKIREVIR
jgi:hypothetical protein